MGMTTGSSIHDPLKTQNSWHGHPGYAPEHLNTMMRYIMSISLCLIILKQQLAIMLKQRTNQYIFGLVDHMKLLHVEPLCRFFCQRGSFPAFDMQPGILHIGRKLRLDIRWRPFHKRQHSIRIRCKYHIKDNI